jgi:class 3 adenylate cyclase
VVVGDLFGEISGHEQSVVGETPNLAARLQTVADPNAVVIAASTRRLVGELFEYRDLGDVELKGIAEPMPAWRIFTAGVFTLPAPRSAAEQRFTAQMGIAPRNSQSE